MLMKVCEKGGELIGVKLSLNLHSEKKKVSERKDGRFLDSYLRMIRENLSSYLY